MKIGIYSPYLSTFGGGERYVLTLAEHLSFKNDVSIFWDKDITDQALERLAINIKNVAFVNNIFSKKHFLLKKLFTTGQYDLLFFLSDGSIPLTLAKNNIVHFQRPFKKVSRFSQLKIKRIKHVICNSNFTKKYIDRVYKTDSSVIYPPVDIGSFKIGIKKDLIISVGRFHPFKKQNEIIKAFKIFSKHCPSWQLVLIGGLLKKDTDYFKEIEKISCDGKIKLLLNEPFMNLKEYYSQAKIYWHAAGFSESKTLYPERMEHFGITTVEAMASGCVPLVFDGGGEKEIVTSGKDGYLWKNTEELIFFTEKLANDESKREELMKSAIDRSHKFSKEIFCKEIDKLMLNLR